MTDQCSHRWALDSEDFGICQECGERKQFKPRYWIGHKWVEHREVYREKKEVEYRPDPVPMTEVAEGARRTRPLISDD